MCELAWLYPNEGDTLRRQALNQCARELLLAQSSDWLFIITNGTMVEYAHKAIKDHIGRFTKLYYQIKKYLSSKICMGISRAKCIFMHYSMHFPKVQLRAAQKQNAGPPYDPAKQRPREQCSFLLCFLWYVRDEIAGLTFQRRANLVYHVNRKMLRRPRADCGDGGLSNSRDF